MDRFARILLPALRARLLKNYDGAMATAKIEPNSIDG
jgi:hypothetical protein